MTVKVAMEKLEEATKDLRSSETMLSKPNRKLIDKVRFIKLANEVREIFEKEERERRLQTA